MIDCVLLGLVWRPYKGFRGRNRYLAEAKGRFRCYLFGEAAMTVAELIEKLSALPDKTARVVKSPGPWDGLE